jgi:hypothetical protein
MRPAGTRHQATASAARHPRGGFASPTSTPEHLQLLDRGALGRRTVSGTTARDNAFNGTVTSAPDPDRIGETIRDQVIVPAAG